MVERQLIDYQTHQHRLINNLANVYTMCLAMQELFALYDKMINNIQTKQDFSLMAPMHMNLAGMKALFCHLGYEGIKTMRECCGANGFSKYSGLNSCIQTVSPFATLEGDYVVMSLQTARALLKNS